ncbi:MAG: hypothetical protein JF587_19870 [Catenulisporales bacterium]|nr:hypothetical protein [Catenulisporales bacterium]
MRLRATLGELGGAVGDAPPIDLETVAAQVEAASPEGAEIGEALPATLNEFRATISGMTAAFGLRAATILIALGRGQPLGELDPVVAAELGRVPEFDPLTSSGTVTIERDGRATTLIAATTVGPPTGPVRLAWPDRHDERGDRDDVWLCTVPVTAVAAGPAAQVLQAARAALERVLPHVGVIHATIRENVHAGHRNALHAALLTIDPAADPDLVMARLEGWRAAIEQLHGGAVEIHWEQA